jgi:flavin-binding protein dodecin
MAEHERYAAISFESFQAAADDALSQMPGGPEGLKRAKVVEQRLQAGGVVGRTQYAVSVDFERDY